MGNSNLWFRSVVIRLAYEWRRIGGLHSLLLRLASIWREDGWQGIQRRFQNLTKKTVSSGVDKFAHSQIPDTSTRTEITSPGVLLIGHPYAITGVGENLRAISLAIGSVDIPFQICNAFDPCLTSSELKQDFPCGSKVAPLNHKFGSNLFCMNANEMDMALTYLGSEIFENSYNIAYWMWELSEFPSQWAGNFRYVQEIWAQSRFVQEAISKKSPVPVVWMPQVVEPGPADPNIAQELGIPKNKFAFLFFFDFTSHIARKNPNAVIKAFQIAFQADNKESVVLIVKMNGIDKHIDDYKRFMHSIGNLDSRIIFIEQVLSDHEIKGLISGCDAFVSLHRSEGFGRGLAEAMYYGKPTIATGYSGNMDFTNHSTSGIVDFSFVPVGKDEYPFWQGQFWAEPDISHAARWMRRLYEDRGLCDSMGKHAAKSIRDTHSALVTGIRMKRRLMELGLL